MNPLESLMLEAIPRGFPPPVDTSDGPTACMMRAERQRALWAMAHDVPPANDKKLIHNLSDSDVTVTDMNNGNRSASRSSVVSA